MSGVVRAERRFRARRRAQRGRGAGPALAAATAVTVVAAGLWLALWSPVLRLNGVAVSGVTVNSMSRLTVGEVLAAARPPLGRSLLRVAPGVIRARVAALPAVAGVEVRRDWPHRLRIVVVERRPTAAVTSPSGVTVVDATGTPFLTLDTVPDRSVGLADVRVSSPLAPGAPLTSPGRADARAALAVLRSLPGTLRMQVSWVTATSPQSVSFALAHGAVVVWGSPGQTSDKLAVLAALLRHRARTYDVSTPAVAVTSG